MRLIPTFLAILFILLAAPLLHAQVVNIESSRMQSDTVGWMGNAGARFQLTSNSQKITDISLRAHLQHKTQKNLWLIIGHYGLLKVGGSKFVNNSFAHLRYNRKLNHVIRWEVFTQAQNNYITNIEARYLVGTGPRFKLADLKSFRLYAASLFMYEYEKERTTPPIYHKDIRNSSYVSFTLKLDNAVELISTTFYQPLLKSMNDFRILNETLLRTGIGKHFAFSVEWNYLFDRFPAANAPKTTYDLGIGVQYNL